MKLVVIILVALASFAIPSQAKAQSAGNVIRQVGWAVGADPMNCLGWNSAWAVQCGIDTLRQRERVRQNRRQQEEFLNRQSQPVSAPMQAPVIQRSAPVSAIPASVNSRLAALHAECNRGSVQACQAVGR